MPQGWLDVAVAFVGVDVRAGFVADVVLGACAVVADDRFVLLTALGPPHPVTAAAASSTVVSTDTGRRKRNCRARAASTESTFDLGA